MCEARSIIKKETLPLPYEIENGLTPSFIEFARHTLPKIEDHLQRALALAKSE